ncbi:regulatory protein, luxR family [Ferrimonas sediminum]|uniref:Regulatory protein, luxR family n=1 Tax=Ferrimonas sediminum TaxID=718193 RepID=A0A1G8X336_9GAMM|nr:helix-turn-helix transcriptional regulator [Ferrimonas sediminum]SDJ84871.1 regulatory protein, luxR family [Ferrimonas sediminum]
MSIETQSCNIDPKHIRRVREFLLPYGVMDFFYSIITHVNRPALHQFKKLGRRLPREVAKARRIICSRDDLREFRHRYLTHFATTDITYKAYFNNHRSGLSVWGAPDLSDNKRSQFRRLLEDYGVSSLAVWHLPIRHHPGWYSEFVFVSDLGREALLRQLGQHQQQIEYQLQLFACHFNELCISELNPIVNFNCLSDKALQVLKLTAEGYSSDEVAQTLSMTESGVYYHLERLKDRLCARNRVQLISQAHTLGLL